MRLTATGSSPASPRPTAPRRRQSPDRRSNPLWRSVAPPATLALLACAYSAGCDPRDRLALINPPFIPIGAPVRWSLVAPSLDLFTENGLAAHPLDQLRSRR
ncbi:MAG: hypothetical protein JF628_14390 [Sphingomonas sp.]|nr:hypothetical protein [Sphingomonas sp.]